MYLYRKFLFGIRLSLDLTVLIVAWSIAVYISSMHAGGTPYRLFNMMVLSLLLLWIVSSEITHLYDDFRSRDLGYEVVLVLKNLLVQALATAVILILVKERSLARLFLVLYPSVLLVLLFIEKYIWRIILTNFRTHGRNLRTVLIIGGGKIGRGFAESIQQNPHFGYKVFGFLDDKKDEHLNGSYMGNISKLESILSDRKVDNVVVALPNYAFRKVEEIINTCEKFTTNVRIIPNYFNLLSPRYNLTMFDRFPLISLRHVKLNEFHWRIIKRGFDTGLSLLLFITLFWWLCPLMAVVIKLTSPGPVFFRQIREGRNNRRFTVYKFRSMVAESKDIDKSGKYQQATKDDPRITSIGRFMRKTNLDEVPAVLERSEGGNVYSGAEAASNPSRCEIQERDQ